MKGFVTPIALPSDHFKHLTEHGGGINCLGRLQNRSGSPDLSSVAGRFSFRDLSESLVDPSKVVSDQYRASIITTLSGRAITGRVVGEEDGKLTVITDPENATKIARIAKGDVDQIEASKISLMPKGLLNVLSEDEVLDLLAYMMSRGNPQDRMFGE